MPQHYSDLARANDPFALPDIETFYVPAWESKTKPRAGERPTDEDGNYLGPGWYWRACLSACLVAFGPFDTEARALASAQEDSQ
jgi:hypothetical protein